MRSMLIASSIFIAGLCAGAHAEELCSAKVQNDDVGGRAVDHLVVTAVDHIASHEDSVLINRIVMPGPENVAIIHWQCSKPDKPYQIAGMNAHGEYIVVGTVVPSTMDTDPDGRPTAVLGSLSAR